MSEPLILPRNCSTCGHFDDYAHCALPKRETVISGSIVEPRLVTCAKHEPKDADDVEGAAV